MSTHLSRASGLMTLSLGRLEIASEPSKSFKELQKLFHTGFERGDFEHHLSSAVDVQV